MEHPKNNLPQIFTYEEAHKVRTQLINDEPWFVAKDVCEILALKNVSQALNADPDKGTLGLDDDEKLRCRIYISGQHRELWLVNESGLYNLIFRSNKPEAKIFRRWVTHEVLPALRKTGTYSLAPQPAKRVLQDNENTLWFRSAVELGIAAARSFSALCERIGIHSRKLQQMNARPWIYNDYELLKVMLACYGLAYRKPEKQHKLLATILGIEDKNDRIEMYRQLTSHGLI
jgi:prophage antirepressor-like protein